MSEATIQLPDGFRSRMEGLLGPESAAFFAALSDPPEGLRVNTLRVSPERFREISPFPLRAIPFPPEGFVVEGNARPGRHPFHAAGVYYLQDPGAMAVAPLLAPQPGERVLDLAAAPGGKATHLAARTGDEGVLVANDVHPTRARELAGNLERCGVRRAAVTCDSVARLAAHFGAWFDRVLLDAPCSGEAMFHKSEAARADWSEAAVAGCARRQADLLGEAADLVRPGGVLVYSTCTFSPEEDEAVIAELLARRRDFEVVELARVPGAAPGNPAWAGEGPRGAELERTIRLWPHRVPGAGHFIAGLRRLHGEASAPPPARPEPLPRGARELVDGFLAERFPVELDGPLLAAGPHVHRLPPELPDLRGVRVVRPGWVLGTLERNRFEPSHALAMGARPGDAIRTLELDPGGPEVQAFLGGEALRAEGEPGWVVVTTGGFPLGWGKRVGSTVKNHYPKGLRRR